MRLRVDSARRLRAPAAATTSARGACCRRTTYDIADTVSLWMGNHSIKTGGVVHLRRHQAAVSAAAERRLPLHRRAGRGAERRSSFSSRSRSCRKRALMFPKAYVHQRLPPGRLARPQQPDAQPRPALRRRDHQGHSRLAGADRQEQRRSAPRVRVGPEGRSEVGGPRRHRPLHAAARDLHHRQGRRRRPQRPGDGDADADRPAVPDLPERAAGVPAGRGAAGRATSRRSRPTSRTSTRGPAASASSASSARGPASQVDANINRGVRSTGFLDMNQAAADSEGRPERGARVESERDGPHAGAGRRDASDSAGAERLPADGPADQRRALLVSGRAHRGAAPDRAARCYGVLHAARSPRIG